MRLIALINRQVALERLGAVATGEFSLAFDLSQRLFHGDQHAARILLFQYALQRDRARGPGGGAGGRSASNMALSLAILLRRWRAAIWRWRPTFEALVVPPPIAAISPA